MERTSRSLANTLLIATLLIPAAASAAGYVAMSQLPPELKQGNVTYLSGGIGEDEVAAIRKKEPSFPLALEFVRKASPGAQYLAGVNVTIKDEQGRTVLNAVSDGPFLLARLPDGKYTVTAEDSGQAKQRNVVVAEDKREHIVMEW